MAVRTRKIKKDQVCRLEGELTVGRITELVWILSDMLNSLNRCVIDLSEISEIDASGIQVICSLHRMAIDRNIPIMLSAPLHGRPGLVVEEAGAPCAMQVREHLGNCLLRKEVVHE